MTFIDKEYYYNEFAGSTIPPDTLDNYIKKASRVISRLIMKNSTDDLPDALKEKVKEAVATQVEYYHHNGGTFMGSNVGSVTLGKFSYSSNEEKKIIPQEVIDILLLTGLLYNGVDSIG